MGRVIIFPTDTVYGIGTSIFDIEGIKRIYEIKRRPSCKQLACLCADVKQIESIAYLSVDAKELINRFLPGALTLILKSKPEVVEKTGYQTIGVRIPDSEIAINILRENGPMLTTSVNESGQVPLNEYDDIVKRYDRIVDKIYPTDRHSSSVPSTIVSFDDDGKLVVIREGEIKAQTLIEALE